MILVPLLLVASQPTTPQVAFTVRFYNPVGSHRPKSYAHLYVSDLDGRHRRQLTFGRETAENARWVDRDHIQFYRSENFGQSNTLLSLDARTSKLTTIGRRKDTGGRPGDQPRIVNPRVLEKLPQEGVDPLSSVGTLLKVAYPTVIKAGKLRPKPVEYAIPAVYRLRKSGDLWLATALSNSTTGEVVEVHRIDASTRKSKPIVEGANDIDWQPARDTFAYTTPRSLEYYGTKRGVWTSELWVGNWRKGQKRRLVGGLANVTSVSLRP